MSTNEASQDLRKHIEATVDSFLSAYEDRRKANDPSVINRVVTPDCTRQLLPASLCKALGAPEEFHMPNDLYEKLFSDDLSLGGMDNLVNKHLSIDVEDRRAAVTSQGDMIYHHGEVVPLEFSWTFYLNEDDTKISKVIEFADAIGVMKMAAIAKERGATARQAQDVDFNGTGYVGA
ncbi:hypothetical protein F53441_8482 [Fusarium austroafricanum]|uniref:Uncharacterized protein n=1 Tax=Fusarium austroafricanum TaxID=2364996 RepID=A0A8H4NXB4_9HYPO|nr:hypothetical protein F53441_8482 [Fusarium austroafricanum]